MGYEAHFFELATGGHSYGKTHDDMAAFISLGYAFLRRAIGWRAN
jgi:prolyl oligopeptidase